MPPDDAPSARFTALVVETVAQLLDLDETELSADTPLSGIEGWDSVNALRVLVFLERELGVPVDYERFAAVTDLAGLAELAAASAGAAAAP